MDLIEIQRKLKTPKSQFNEFGKYKYRSCEDILEAVKPLLTDTPLIVTDEIVLIGNRYYVKAIAQYGNIQVTAFAREPESKKGMDESQITGTASSYARKYALNGLFAIDDTKDSDATNKHEEEPKKPMPHKPPKPTKKDFDFMASCRKAKEMLGDDIYYQVLNIYEAKHSNEVAEEAKELLLADLREEAKKRIANAGIAQS